MTQLREVRININIWTDAIFLVLSKNKNALIRFAIYFWTNKTRRSPNEGQNSAIPTHVK